MSNEELSLVFEDLADLSEIEGDKWGAIAYRRVAASIMKLTEDISYYAERGELRSIDGVGAAIESKIKQYLADGYVQKHREMMKKYPVDFSTLRKIQGLGSKTIATLYVNLGIRNIEDLREAIDNHSISSLRGFSTKTEEKLRKGIEIFSKVSGRKLLADVYDYIQETAEELRRSGLFGAVTVAGSTRRMKETVGDVDILAISDNPGPGIDYFLNMKNVREVIVSGESKVTAVLDVGLTCDLRILDRKSYGAAIQYFTGSKEHNIRLRDIAIQKGLKLNEYGLFRGEIPVAGENEEGIYHALGMDWVPPELRENTGEIEAASASKLPKLVEFADIKGDFHTHTSRTDGIGTIGDLAGSAESLGLEYLIVTDHSKSLPVAHGLREEQFMELFSEIDKFNESGQKIRLLKGIEMEILKDGSLDMGRKTLEGMDFVMASMHQWVTADRAENTGRLIRAVESGMVDVVAHPTGRLIGSREPYDIDFDALFEACSDNAVALEINGFSERSDLPPDLIRKAAGYKLKFTLGSDTHRPGQMNYLKFACSIARRGWRAKEDILNTLSWESLRRFRHL